MCRYHPSVKVMSFLLVLYYAKQRISSAKPISQPAELQILYAARRRDYLDILNSLCEGEPIHLIDSRNPSVSKELLDIRIETAALEKTVTEQHHAILLVSSEQALVHQRLPVPYRISYGDALWG